MDFLKDINNIRHAILYFLNKPYAHEYKVWRYDTHVDEKYSRETVMKSFIYFPDNTHFHYSMGGSAHIFTIMDAENQLQKIKHNEEQINEIINSNCKKRKLQDN